MTDGQFIALLVSTVVTLVGAIVFLYKIGEKRQKHFDEKSQENLLRHIEISTKVTVALVEQAKSNEHLANSIDTLPERIVDKMLANGFNRKK